MIKAISFDLWDTLIKKNPEYNSKRISYLHKKCLFTHLEIEDVLNRVKKSYDKLIYIHGFHYDSASMYQTIINELNIKHMDGEDLRCKMNTLFLENVPLLYSEETENIIAELSLEYPLYITSNTLLIDGQVLRMALDKLGILKYFKGTFFSSDVGYSKPNPLMFKYVHDRICVEAEHIVHIGDNYRCDIEGAKNYGFNAMLVNNPTHMNNMSFIKEHIKRTH